MILYGGAGIQQYFSKEWDTIVEFETMEVMKVVTMANYAVAQLPPRPHLSMELAVTPS